MDFPSKVSETLSLFSLVEQTVSKVFVEGIMGLSEEQKNKINELAFKVGELGLEKLSSELSTFLKNCQDRKSVRILMRIYTLNRMLKMEYSKMIVLREMEES
ncbi:MAG: hypothetical protein ACTSW1_10690 [Candidatus Hodarchaeales archaeon]